MIAAPTPLSALDIAELLRISDEALDRAETLIQSAFFKNFRCDKNLTAQPSAGEGY